MLVIIDVLGPFDVFQSIHLYELSLRSTFLIDTEKLCIKDVWEEHDIKNLDFYYTCEKHNVDVPKAPI